jgi:RNA polymerase sigma-B factor
MIDERQAPGDDLDDVVTELARQGTGDPRERARLRDRIIEVGLPLAVRIARFYQGRGEPFEDLVQVAAVGLIKAVDGYDPGRGPFSHFAGPTVRGELKKHFRDLGWTVRVPRRLQELKLEMSQAHRVLTHKLGRAPSVADFARYLDLDEKQVAEGLDLAHAYQPVSLDAAPPGKDQTAELGAVLGARDPELESLPDRLTLAALLTRVPERERRILHLRFSGNMTQAQIAAECGISQMHVSRLLAQTLAWLREAMAVSGGVTDD